MACVLKLNNFGIPEPLESKEIIPNVILVPLLVFDQKKNRIGYGKGFYDKYLNGLKNILSHSKINIDYYSEFFKSDFDLSP